jgi:hypothetical protein
MPTSSDYNPGILDPRGGKSRDFTVRWLTQLRLKEAREAAAGAGGFDADSWLRWGLVL